MRAPRRHPIPMALLLASVACAFQLSAQTVALTNAAQIRDLTAEQAAKRLPVRLRGVVMDHASPTDYAIVLADETAGIYLLADTNLFQHTQSSDLLEIRGVTDPGQFAPIVRVRGLKKIGTAPIPPPRPVTYGELLTGAPDAQWVEITGVVRRLVTPVTNIWRVYIAADGGTLSVRGNLPRDPQIQEDAEIRFAALCFYQFNQKRQVLTPILQIPRGTPIEVVKPAPADPFAVPVRPADSLLQFTPENPGGHRVHVRGVVTHCQSGTTVWIRDGASGLRIHAPQPDKLEPGDEIDVLGFPAYGSVSPLLEDAIFRKIGGAPPPSPHFITNAANAFEFEEDLIAMDAVLTDVQPVLEGTALSLKAGNAVFKALLKNSDEPRKLPDCQPGSKVRITGICSVVHDDVRPLMGVWQPQTFQILLRSPDDLAVVTRPPWWTPSHIILLLGAIIGGLLLATGVGALLARRRLHEQERQRAMAEAEFAAILSERNRMAREIHDTLAQGLVATSVQLRLAKKQSAGASGSLRHHLESAQQLVLQSLQEARNSIWNMRSQVLENGDLATALKDILKQVADGVETKTEFEVTGRPQRLAPVIESNLLRVGQEAITNAARHAQARHIRVRLDFREKQFELAVSDDGRGFDSAGVAPAREGFGLVGMRERVAALQGHLQIRSAPGEGAEIKLTIPLSEKS